MRVPVRSAVRFTLRFGSVIAVVCLSSVLYSQTTPSPSLLVLSKHDHTLSIVDPSTLKVIAHMPVGNDPHEVIASTDGATAYVSNYGFGSYNTLAVLDLVAHRALPSIDLGPLRGPHGLTFVGGKTWFTAEAAKSIGRYDSATQKVDWIMGTGQNRTHMIYVSDDQQRIITHECELRDGKHHGTRSPPHAGPTSRRDASGRRWTPTGRSRRPHAAKGLE